MTETAEKQTVQCPIHKIEFPISTCLAKQKIVAEDPTSGMKGIAYTRFKNSCGGCKIGLELYSQTIMPEQRPAATPEPMSKPGQKEVFPELMKDIAARRDVGIKKYGYPLQTLNGRDAMNDAYQEVLDLAVYFKQAIMERDDDRQAGTHFKLEEKIIKWAEDRGLYDGGTWESQLDKLEEEILEWKDEVMCGDMVNEMLEIGDMFVVLTNIAKMRGFSLLECGWAAYNKIKNRTGHMENGTFVKDTP